MVELQSHGGHVAAVFLGENLLLRISALSLASEYRAFPGSEFVVANTLAKWKKLKPNEIDFSQGFTFSQREISRSCSVFNSLPISSDFCHLLISFANSLDPDQARQNAGPDLDPNCLTP